MLSRETNQSDSPTASTTLSASLAGLLEELDDMTLPLLLTIMLLSAGILAAYLLLPLCYAKANPHAFCFDSSNTTAFATCEAWLSEQKPSNFASKLLGCQSQSSCAPLDYITLSMSSTLVMAVTFGFFPITNIHKNILGVGARGDGIVTGFMLGILIANTSRCFTPTQTEICGSPQGSLATLICLISCIKKAIEYRHPIASAANDLFGMLMQRLRTVRIGYRDTSSDQTRNLLP
jgi:hypothetical protein